MCYGMISLVHYILLLSMDISGKGVRERSGSVVECLAQDRGDAGSCLTGVIVLCP